MTKYHFLCLVSLLIFCVSCHQQASLPETIPVITTEENHIVKNDTTIAKKPNDFKNDTTILKKIAETEQNIDMETGFPWGVHHQPTGYHSQFAFGTRVRPTRQALEYAALLIASPKTEHQQHGCQILEKIIALQDQNPNSKTFGIWSWYYEEPLGEMATPDYNWADFQGSMLAVILHDYADRLPVELRKKTETSLEYCARAIIKRDVGPAYTNIAMMGATVTAAAGELLDRTDFLDYGRKRIKRNLDHYLSIGNFNEYNSPSYTPIVIRELERMLYLVKDTECRKTAVQLLEGAWLTVAEHYHVPTRQWAGPHSRNYSDLLPDETRNRILADVGALPEGVAPPVSIFIPCQACPDHLWHYFVDIPHGDIERHHLFNEATPGREEQGTTWLNDTTTLGSASYHTFWEQTRGLIAYWKMPNAETAVLKARLLHNGNDFASGCARHQQSKNKVVSAFGFLNNWGSMHPSFDRPKNGVFNATGFEIVYQLEAQGAIAKQINAQTFELVAGNIHAILHVAEHCVFDDRNVTWRVEQTLTMAKVIGTFYQGEPKDFNVNEMGEIRIGVALELLEGDTSPADAKVVMIENQASGTFSEPCYGVIWEPVTGHIPLVAPAIATRR